MRPIKATASMGSGYPVSQMDMKIEKVKNSDERQGEATTT
jgi:hypothetical protein